MRIDTRRTGALLAGLAMAAGIAYFLVSDSDANQAPGGRLPGDSSVSPTPTESPSPTTEPPPELNNTGNDFEAIWRSIAEYRLWLQKHPDRSLVGEIFARRCSCYRRERRLLGRLENKGWRFAGNGIETISVELIDRPAPHVAVIRVIDRQGAQTFVDENGEVVREGVGWKPTSWVFTLGKDVDGAWRLRDLILEGPA
jgi:hypothetical protein